MDFILLDIEEDRDISIILCQPNWHGKMWTGIKGRIQARII